MLRAHLLARGLTEADSQAFVFGDGKGGPLHYSKWRTRVWLPACAKASVEGAGFHDLRWANATVMIAEGIDVKTAQQRLGHSDVRMTLGLYARVIEGTDRHASDVLASRFLGNVASNTPNTGNARWTRDGGSEWRHEGRSTAQEKAALTRTFGGVEVSGLEPPTSTLRT